MMKKTDKIIEEVLETIRSLEEVYLIRGKFRKVKQDLASPDATPTKLLVMSIYVLGMQSLLPLREGILSGASLATDRDDEES